MSCFEVAELELLHLANVQSMTIAYTWKLKVVKIAENGTISERHVFVDIHMQFAPNPLLLIFSPESPLKMGKGILPSGSCDLLFGGVALEGMMDMVEDCLLAVMETSKAHFLGTEGFDQVVEFIEEDLVNRGDVAG